MSTRSSRSALARASVSATTPCCTAVSSRTTHSSGWARSILNGARIGEGSLIAASALVPQGIVVPPRSLVTGVPGSVRRELSDAEIANNRHNAQVYQRLIELHRDAVN